jgi:hypothetical protein
MVLLSRMVAPENDDLTVYFSFMLTVKHLLSVMSCREIRSISLSS